jgi:glycosyltransferase involved in cell wall biosynthesis
LATWRPTRAWTLLLEALRSLPPRFSLHIAGYCQDDTLRRQIRDTLAKHPAATRITWHDAYVPEESVSVLFAQADVLVLPYRRIDESGVRLQALRHGVPVVAAHVGAFADDVHPPLGITFEPGSASALAQALLAFESRRAAFATEAIWRGPSATDGSTR